MSRTKQRRASRWIRCAAALCAACTGCLHAEHDPVICDSPLPRELVKTTLPSYVVEAPDILLIDAIRVTPKPPYKIQPLDGLVLQVPGAYPTAPIGGLYVVDPDGTINLGFSYGIVPVLGLTIPEAKSAIEKQLKLTLKPENAEASVGLGQSRALQQIRGEHLVRPDGTVGLGLYGSVRVTGLTLPECKAAIEAHLSQYLQKPEVSVDVFAYNSKKVYVIFDGGGIGQSVTQLPATGNETVLDIMAHVNGLTAIADKYHMWIARPAPACNGCDQILPIDWVAITTKGRTATNYQLLPGDRIYVKADGWVELDNRMARFLAPFERLFGFTLLGNSTVRALQQYPPNNTNNSGGNSNLNPIP
jgi:polysaccharide export outer membrane protein